MKARIVGIILFAVIFVMISGCNGSDKVEIESKDSTMSLKNGTERVINAGLSFASKEDVIYQAFEDYIINAGKVSKPIVRFTFTVADWDTEKQAADIKSLIEKNMDVIVMMPQDSRVIVESIKTTRKAGIPVMTYNRAASPDADERADAHVGLDTVDQAYTTAIALFEMMKRDGITPRLINVMGDLRDENAVNRNKGLKKAAEERGVDIIEGVTTDWSAEKADSGLYEALQEHPDANALFVASDVLMPGVKNTLQKLKKWEPYGIQGHMYIGSQDVNPLGAELLKTKYIDVDTAFDIWPMSTSAVDTIIKLALRKPVNRNQLIKGRIFYHNNILTEQNVWANDYKIINWKK